MTLNDYLAEEITQSATGLPNTWRLLPDRFAISYPKATQSATSYE
jgi:hypothetical protein